MNVKTVNYQKKQSNKKITAVRNKNKPTVINELRSVDGK